MTAHRATLLALAEAMRARRWRLTTAESCTGGLLAAACTALAGSSDWFERGFVTYSNEAKIELLAVPAALIARDGAVSGTVAAAMAAGALSRSPGDLALSITGVAGPGGGSERKPVGTVWLGHCVRGEAPRAVLLSLSGDRAAIRAASVSAALERLIAFVDSG